jgi:hypothetical protein
VWRCAGHPQQTFASETALQSHLESEHGTEGLSQSDAHEIARLSYVRTADNRTVCPFCEAAGPFERGLANHMAFHMEQLACFALPRSWGSANDDDESGEGATSNGRKTDAALDEASGSSASVSLVSKTGSEHVECAVDDPTSQVQSRELWCEFVNLKGCSETFRLDDDASWIAHHADHLGGSYPSQLMCWFCDHPPFVANYFNSAEQNFAERMTHIKWHIEDDVGLNHRAMRADFHVVTHLYQNGLLDSDLYRRVMDYTDTPPPFRLPAQAGPSSVPADPNRPFVCDYEGCDKTYRRQCDLEYVFLVPFSRY